MNWRTANNRRRVRAHRISWDAAWRIWKPARSTLERERLMMTGGSRGYRILKGYRKYVRISRRAVMSSRRKAPWAGFWGQGALNWSAIEIDYDTYPEWLPGEVAKARERKALEGA